MPPVLGVELFHYLYSVAQHSGIGDNFVKIPSRETVSVYNPLVDKKFITAHVIKNVCSVQRRMYRAGKKGKAFTTDYVV